MQRLHDRQLRETKDLQANKKNKVKKKNKSRYLILSVLFLFTALIGGNYFYETYIYNPKDSRIVEINNRIGFTTSGRKIFYRTDPELNSYDQLIDNCEIDFGPSAMNYGCFDPEFKKIFILNIEDGPLKNLMYVFSAHEFLHRVYDGLSVEEKASLNKELLVLWENGVIDEELKSTITNIYKAEVGSDLFYDELHSFVGSQVTRPGLVLSKHYDKYFVNRDNLVVLFQESNNTLKSLENELDQQADYLISLESRLNELNVTLVSLDNQLNYNYYTWSNYRYNLVVDEYNFYVEEYNNLYSSYESAFYNYDAKLKSFNGIYDDLKRPKQDDIRDDLTTP